MPLSPEEARVLGCLLEKERTTPDAYPLSLNALVSACNQSTNRSPVVQYRDDTVEAALDELRERSFVRRGVYPGSRVIKYRHVLDEALGIGPPEMAVLCVMLLRGPQTPGELKARTERLHPFKDLDRGGGHRRPASRAGTSRSPVACRVSPARRRPGPGSCSPRPVARCMPWSPRTRPSSGSRIRRRRPRSRQRHGPGDDDALEDRVAALEAEVAALRRELEALRDCLGG